MVVDNLERVEPAHMLDAIYGWVAFHAGQEVRRSGCDWLLNPPERRGTSWGGVEPFHDTVVVSVSRSGTGFDYFTVEDVDEVRVTRTTLTVRRKDRRGKDYDTVYQLIKGVAQ
jgi:hypothetical protein